MLGAYYPGKAYPGRAPDYSSQIVTRFAQARERTLGNLTPLRRMAALTPARTLTNTTPIRGMASLTPARTLTITTPRRTLADLED